MTAILSILAAYARLALSCHNNKAIFAVIASGEVVSGVIDLTQVLRVRSIFVPNLTSGDLLLQGSFGNGSGSTISSGSWARILDTRAVGSGDLRIATGIGSRFIPIPHALQETLPPYLRLEAAVAQTAPATLTLLTRG